MVTIGGILSCFRHPSKIKHRIVKGHRIREVMEQLPGKLPNASLQDKPVYVSLTSYGRRLESVYLAIRSIMLQTVQPNKVILCISEDYDNVSLPDKLLELEPMGLEIRRGYENLGSHLKYIPAMSEYPEADIITIDDDAIYAPDVVESLLLAKMRNPDCVVARRVHRIVVHESGIAPYKTWEWEWKEANPIPRRSLCAIGVGGILYPAGLLSDKALDVEAIKVTSLEADDLWLKAVETACGVMVAWAPNDCVHPYTIQGTQEDALYNANVGQGRNDAIMQRLVSYFSLRPEDFLDFE